MLMMILAIVSCQLGSAGNGGRYRSACLSCRPGLRATWRHFCILRTIQTFFAYCVQHRPLPIVYFVCFILRSMVMKEWVRRGCRLWTFLIYVTNQNIHLLHCCICILFLYILSLTLYWLLLAWAARPWSVKDYEEDDIFVMFCWIFSLFYSVCFAIALLHALYAPNVAIPSLPPDIWMLFIYFCGRQRNRSSGLLPRA